MGFPGEDLGIVRGVGRQEAMGSLVSVTFSQGTCCKERGTQLTSLFCNPRLLPEGSGIPSRLFSVMCFSLVK